MLHTADNTAPAIVTASNLHTAKTKAQRSNVLVTRVWIARVPKYAAANPLLSKGIITILRIYPAVSLALSACHIAPAVNTADTRKRIVGAMAMWYSAEDMPIYAMKQIRAEVRSFLYLSPNNFLENALNNIVIGKCLTDRCCVDLIPCKLLGDVTVLKNKYSVGSKSYALKDMR